MGISDLALGAPRGLFSTQDYNEDRKEQRKRKLEILEEKEERAKKLRELRETEGVTCVCGVKIHPAVDTDHARSAAHCNYVRDVEGVVCMCGEKYHLRMDALTHKFHPRHVSYLHAAVTCECGQTLQRRWLASHLLSKKHASEMKRVERRNLVAKAAQTSNDVINV